MVIMSQTSGISVLMMFKYSILMTIVSKGEMLTANVLTFPETTTVELICKNCPYYSPVIHVDLNTEQCVYAICAFLSS